MFFCGRACSPWDTEWVFTGKLVLVEKQCLYCDLQISLAFEKFRKKRGRERMTRQDRRSTEAEPTEKGERKPE